MNEKPRTVAVIGASSDRRTYGNKALRALRQRGFNAVPVNPNEASVEGLPCYPSVLAFPGPIDLATLYVPPEIGERLMAEISAKGIPEVWLNPGADAPAVVAQARAHGVEPVLTCSILAIGERPSDY